VKVRIDSGRDVLATLRFQDVDDVKIEGLIIKTQFWGFPLCCVSVESLRAVKTYPRIW
jgi:hypothetical protein